LNYTFEASFYVKASNYMTHVKNPTFKTHYILQSRILTHILFWFLYYIFFSLLWAKEGNYYKSFSLELVLMPIRIGATYLSIYFLMPTFLLKEKVVKFFVAYSIMLLIAGVGQRLLIFFFYELFFPDELNQLWDFAMLIRAIVLVNTSVILISAFKMYSFWREEKYKNQKQDEGLIKIRADKRFYRIIPSEIQYVEGLGNYVTFYLSSRKPLISYMSLKEAKESLPENFLRVHKSFIINKNWIDSYNNESVEINNRILPIGKSFDISEL